MIGTINLRLNNDAGPWLEPTFLHKGCVVKLSDLYFSCSLSWHSQNLQPTVLHRGATCLIRDACSKLRVATGSNSSIEGEIGLKEFLVGYSRMHQAMSPLYYKNILKLYWPPKTVFVSYHFLAHWFSMLRRLHVVNLVIFGAPYRLELFQRPCLLIRINLLRYFIVEKLLDPGPS